MDSNAKLATQIEVAEECLRRFGCVRIRVNGASMLPAIWPGEILLVEAVPADSLVPGDVVLFRRNARLFAHRIAKSASLALGNFVVTRGDALPSPDPFDSQTQILGRVRSIITPRGRRKRVARLGFPTRAIAFASAHCGLIPRGMLRISRLARRLSSRKAF